MEDGHMLTTFDNPFNPFDQFDAWQMFDIEKGYQTSERLAKVVKLSDEMSQKEEDEEIERGINVIIQNDILNIYKRVTEKDYKNSEQSDD